MTGFKPQHPPVNGERRYSEASLTELLGVAAIIIMFNSVLAVAVSGLSLLL